METRSLDQVISVGNELVEQGKFKELLELADQILAHAPNHPAILNLSVYANWYAGDKFKALEHQEKMLELEPANQYLNKRHIHFAHELKDPRRIAAACRFADVHCQLDAGMLNLWGIAENDLGNFQESQSILKRLTQKFPDFLNGYRSLSLPLINLGMEEEAVTAFSKFLSPWNGAINKSQSANEVASQYDAISDDYDTNSLHLEFAKKLIAFSSEFFDFRKTGCKFLDLACGTGTVGRELAALGPVDIVGVDLSPQMLQLAARKKIYRRLEKGDLVECAAKESADQFDAIFSSCALYHIADLEPVLSECKRLLVPGGFLFFSTDPATDDFTIAQQGESENEYAHSRKYLRTLKEKFLFSEFHVSILEHRRYPGFWCAYRK